MKTLLARLTWVKIVEGTLLIILGLLVGIIGGIKPLDLSSALFICIAIFLFIDGIVTLISFILDPKTNFSLSAIIGALFIAIGIVLCVPSAQQAINQIITVFVGGMLITTGAAYLAKSISQCIFKAPIGWILINFLVTIICIALGVVSLVFYAKDTSSEVTLMAIYIILGTSITVLGIFDLFFAIQTHKAKLKAESIKPEQTQHEEFKEDESIIIDGEVKTAKRKRNKKIKAIEDNTKELPLNEEEKQEN